MKSIVIAAFACIALSLALVLRADRPTTRPTDSKVSELITKLGHEDFRVRESAQEDLRKIGKSALPDLQQATKSPDPEVATRAEALVREMQKPPAAPVRPQGPFDMGQGMVFIAPNGMRAQVQIQVGNGAVRHMTVNENGRSVSLHEDQDGIKLTITEPDKDGKSQTKEYKAKNADELKTDSPDAFAEYERLTRMNQVRAGVLQHRIPAAGINMRRLDQMLKQQGIEMPKMVLPGMNPAAEEFGIDIEDADQAIKAQLGNGAIVSDVQPNSRAAKLGLRPFDLIQKLNNTKIESADDLEKAIDNDGQVAIEILRQGKSLRLEEKK